MPLPTCPGIIATNINMVPPTEVIPTISPLLAETWDKVKDVPKGGNVGRIPDALGAGKSVASRTEFYFSFQLTPLLLCKTTRRRSHH